MNADDPLVTEHLHAIFADSSGAALIHCDEGCELGVVRAAACQHGKSINPLCQHEDLEGIVAITTIAQRVGTYFQALVNTGFTPHYALYLAECGARKLLEIDFG